MERKSRTMIAVALSASFWLAGVALAAEKPPLKDAVKDPKAAAQKVIPKQVTKADSSAAATAAAAQGIRESERRALSEGEAGRKSGRLFGMGCGAS